MSYRPPFYKRYPQDYLSSATTRKMSLAEHGVYKRLLDYAWLEEPTATLPKNLSILAKLTGIDRRVLSKFTVKYQGLFSEVPGDSQRIYNPRLKAEYEEFLQHCQKKRLAGLESGRVRRAKRTDVRTKSNNTDSDRDTDKEVREEQNQQPSARVTPDSLEQETKEAAFGVFWEQWPRKQQKVAALRAWMKIPISEYAAIMSGLEKWQKSDQWARRIIPHAATWLNQKRWQDEDVPQKGLGNGKQTGSDLAIQNARALGLTQVN